MRFHTVSTETCHRTEKGNRRVFWVAPPNGQAALVYEAPDQVRGYAGTTALVPLLRLKPEEQATIEQYWEDHTESSFTKLEVRDGEFVGLVGYYTLVPEGQVRKAIDRLGAELLVP